MRLKYSLNIFFLTILLSLSLLTPAHAFSERYYIGLKPNTPVSSLSDLPLSVVQDFKVFDLLKISTENIETIKNHPDVEFVEIVKEFIFQDGKNSILKTSEFENTVSGEVPWGVSYIGAPLVWNHTQKGAGVKVLVLDTGIQKNHPAISNSIIKAKDFTNSEVSQYVPYSFYDVLGHGTHVAATIAGNGFNNLHGVAPNVDLYIGKVCFYICEKTTGLISALSWAIEEKVNVINMSMSLNNLGPKTFKRLFSVIERNNILVVASAGNNGVDPNRRQIAYPATINTVISVGAHDQNSILADFSSKGERVDLVAPGVDIISASPTRGYESTTTLLKRESGTSMAAPHVTGVVALMIAAAPHLKVLEIRRALIDSVRVTKESQSDPFGYGAGYLDAQKAVNEVLRL